MFETVNTEDEQWCITASIDRDIYKFKFVQMYIQDIDLKLEEGFRGYSHN